MKNFLAVLLLCFLTLDCDQSTKKTAEPEKKNSVQTEKESVSGSFSSKTEVIEAEKIKETKSFPWSPENPCQLNDYNITGVIPEMYDSLTSLGLKSRLTNGFNPKKSPANYHREDIILNGKKYSAAIDISVRCLNDDQIRSLLEELSLRGFAGWYRKYGKDGWKGDNHIHAIWVASPLKPQLKYQVKKWLMGKNGLKSNSEYKFWAPKPETIDKIRLIFEESNPI